MPAVQFSEPEFNLIEIAVHLSFLLSIHNQFERCQDCCKWRSPKVPLKAPYFG